MSEALRYALRSPGRPELALAVAHGGASRVHLPDAACKARFIAAVAKARCEADEELELLGAPVSGLDAAARSRLLRRVGVVSPAVALMTNLNAWENICLPAAYHGSLRQERIAQIAREVLEGFGVEARPLLSRVPDQLGTLHRLLVAFVRALVAEPELAIVDALDAGLSREESACIERFEAEYLARQPAGTLVFVDSREQPI